MPWKSKAYILNIRDFKENLEEPQTLEEKNIRIM